MATLHANDKEKLEVAMSRFLAAYTITEQYTEPRKHILAIVTAEETKVL